MMESYYDPDVESLITLFTNAMRDKFNALQLENEALKLRLNELRLKLELAKAKLEQAGIDISSLNFGPSV